jgi:hypothetical protein
MKEHDDRRPRLTTPEVSEMFGVTRATLYRSRKARSQSQLGTQRMVGRSGSSQSSTLWRGQSRTGRREHETDPDHCTNQKGGVGKTSTVLTLARCFADEGQCVLMIDTDPQGNLWTTLRGLELYAQHINSSGDGQFERRRCDVVATNDRPVEPDAET